MLDFEGGWAKFQTDNFVSSQGHGREKGALLWPGRRGTPLLSLHWQGSVFSRTRCTALCREF